MAGTGISAANAGNHGRLNVFIVETRFQALVALLIARSMPDTDNLVCHYREEIGSFLSRFPFVRAKAIAIEPLAGLFRRQRLIRRVLHAVLDEIRHFPMAREVHLHTTKLQGPLFNYYVNFLRQHVTWANMHFNIITDGAFNFHRGNMSDSDSRTMQRKDGNLLYRLFGLTFYPYSGDRFGIEADVIEKIYLLPKAPHEYDLTRAAGSRVLDIPLVDLGLTRQATSTGKRGLVIGEKLIDKGYLSEAEELQVAETIGNRMKAHGITQVDYVKHPLSDHPSLRLPWYTDLVIDGPVEIAIMENDYSVIAGVRSTGLFTARLLSSDHCDVLSVGIDLCRNRRELAMKIKQAFLGMNISVIAATE